MGLGGGLRRLGGRGVGLRGDEEVGGGGDEGG